jgi:RNA-dependent RNA polymerase
MDPDCLKLARLCSQAVDYPKNGIPVNLDEHRLPHTLIRFKPDWTAAEVVSPRQSDYYKSTRALGYLYRAIDLEDPNDIVSETEPAPLTDAISLALMPLIQSKIPNYTGPDDCSLDIGELLQRYKDELQYICTTHTLSDDPSVRLLEEEIVVGTILAKCTQQRWRRSRIYRMALCVSALVNHFQCLLEGDPELDPCGGLERAWAAWELCSRHKEDFGTNSFGLIALGVIFDALDRLSD